MDGLLGSILVVGGLGTLVGLYGIWQKHKLEKREAEERERHA